LATFTGPGTGASLRRTLTKHDFEILEGIRGLAAFAVLLNHSRGGMFIGGRVYLSQPDATLWDKVLIALFQITSLGPQAVIVFFVLSGFCIAHSLRNEGASSVRFYQRRIVRLVPPCVGGLALAWLAYMTTPFGFTFANLTAQYWSLYHEAIFYGMAPPVAAAAWRPHFAVVATLGYLLGLVVGNGGIAHNFVFQYAFYFAVGVMAYHRRDLLARLVFSKGMFALSSILAIGLMIVTTVYPLPHLSMLIAAVFSLVLICNFIEHRITNGPLKVLGAMSYTLYVTHIAAICMWAHLLQILGFEVTPASRSLWLWMTAVPVGLLVSYGMYLIIERPAVKLLDRMREVESAPGLTITTTK
jgi:peptidoglycan/LPS O-acetylase OafA/YrhL